MNRDQARNLVRQTLTQSFDKARFRNFALEVLNKFDESKAFTSNKTYIKHAFQDHVERFERLGTYTSPDDEKLDVLVVHLTKQSKLERARTAIRNFVADHLKQRDGKDAALVAFVSPTEKQWRFSYVKMEYGTVAKESGKVGVETRLTPARRFSYIVGEGESCHTAQTRFIDLLQDTENNPRLGEIEDAFSVEAVTREFFRKYADLFGEIQKALEKLAAEDTTIRNEFARKQVRTADFAKKLMGQIVFLYFIQKKGWMGVAKGQDWGTGPHDFLRRLIGGDCVKYENFFNDILEPLFYDTLATDRGHEAWCKRFECRIPFLNGGLFEPLADYDWRKTDIVLPNSLFTNDERFDEFSTGTGILDMFDRYNFTVNEAEPLEKEVAIDPEMLGKVFENLIEENLRKGLGSYYTPREIVHYMCQESLINYLDTAINSRSETIGREKRKQAEFADEKTEQSLLIAATYREVVPRADLETFVHLGDQISHYEAVEAEYRIKMPKSIINHAKMIDEKLADISICDPAVGSGAFPVGMMTEIVRARSALTPYFNDVHDRTPYHFKRHAIQNCLYGVDIDPGAVEIAKLRLWLSLVVDEQDVKQIKPLPNLFYKIVTGDSLIGIQKGELENWKALHRLETLKPLYFDEGNKQKKEGYRREIDKLIAEVTNGNKSFDFEIYFSEVFHNRNGFDVIVANPPYVGEKGNKLVFRQIKEGPLKPFYQRKSDLFYFFFHVAINIAKSEGSVAFITTNYYPTATQGLKLRMDLKARTSILRLINFNEIKIFDSALGQHNMVTFLEKGRHDDAVCNSSVTRRSGRVAPAVLHNIMHGSDADTDYWQVKQFNLYEGTGAYIRLSGTSGAGEDSLQSILAKLQVGSSNLGSVCNVNQGILTGVDKVKPSHLEKFPRGDFHKGDGVYVLNRLEKSRLDADRSVFKPWFKNSDIHCYFTNNVPREFVIYATRDLDLRRSSPLYRHFLKFEKVIKARNQDRGEMQAAVKLGKWWAIFAARREVNFEGPKIVAPQRSYKNTFGYNNSPWYASADVYYITQNNPAIALKYVLALLNSKFYFTWLYVKGKRKGEMLELYQKPLSEIPIKRISPDEQKPFIKLVDRILTAKQRDVEADVSASEQELDELVYALYGLTPEEIKIVESASGKASA
jgi:type I restriction-modification system DNA methylase subunit